MASGLVGTAFVKVTPDTSGFGSALSGQMAPAAAAAGTTVSQRLSSALGSGITRSAGLINRGFDSAFTAASTMASSSGSRIARAIGGGVTTVLGPIGRMRDGFMNSSAAASSFSGLAGTIGGRMRTAVDAVSGAAGRIGSMFTRSGAEARSSIGSMTSGLGSLTKAIGGAAAAAAALNIGRAVFASAEGIQQARAALTGLYGSAQQAGDMLGRIRQLASGSSISFEAFSQGAQSLAYMGYQGDQAIGILNNVGRALVGAGKGSEAMTQVTDAMLSMVNQGKATTEDINRISQAGIPAWEALATHAGMSIADVRKAVEGGKISIQDMVQSIQDASGPTFSKLLAASDAASNTFQNTWARVKDNFLTSFGFMAEGLLTQLGPAIAGVGTALAAGMTKIPALFAQIGAFLAPLGGIFTNLWAAAQPFVQGFGVGFLGVMVSLGTVFQTVIGPALEWITGLFAGLTGSNATLVQILGGLVGAFVALSVAVKTVTTVVNVAKGAMALFNLVLTANPVGLLIAAIAALVGAFIYLWNTSEGFRNFWIGLWQTVQSVAVAVWNFLVGFFTSEWNGIAAIGRAIFGGLAAFFSGIWESIRGVVVGAWTMIQGFLNGSWSQILSGAQQMFGSLLGLVASLPGSILRALGNLGGLLFSAGADMITGMINGVRSMIGRLLGVIADMARSAVGTVKSWLGIGSPSKVFAGLGVDTMAGFERGLDKGGDSAVATARDVADRVAQVGTTMRARIEPDRSLTGLSGTRTLGARIDESAMVSSVQAGVLAGLDGSRLQVDGDGVAALVNKTNRSNARR